MLFARDLSTSGLPVWSPVVRWFGVGFPYEMMGYTVYTGVPGVMYQIFVEGDHHMISYVPLWDELSKILCKKLEFQRDPSNVANPQHETNTYPI